MEFDPMVDAELRISRKDELIDKYLSNLENGDFLGESDLILATDIADALYIPNKPLQKTVVIIPVAAASEQTTIGHAIDEYARQIPLKPFSIVLGLNIDTDKPGAWEKAQPAVAQTLENLDAAKKRHPGLDIRSSYMEYNDPRIGEIRRDLWNGVLMTYRADGISANEEMVGINHDIDVLHIPRQYIRTIQKRYANPIRAVGPAYAQTRHGWDDNHPNTSKAVVWTDFVNSAAEIGYEAGAIIPMSFYSSQGGFEAARKTHEVGSLTIGNTPAKLLRTGRLVTSPRRYIDRLPKTDMTQIWTPDSFSSGDACRTPDYIAEQADLSRDGLMKILNSGRIYDVPTIFRATTAQISNELFLDDTFDELTSRKEAIAFTSKVVQERFASNLRLARRIMELCQPEDLKLPPQQMVPERYDYEMQSAVNQVVARNFKIPDALA